MGMVARVGTLCKVCKYQYLWYGVSGRYIQYVEQFNK